MKLGSNPDVALTEVMSKVQQVRGQLPGDAEDPTIVKGTGMQFAIMYLAMQNPNMSSEQLTEYIERVIRPRMSTIEGVAEVQILGAANYSMRVWIDPIRLAARGMTAAEVLNAINSANFLSAPGKTKNEYVASSITLQSTLQTPEAFGALPLQSEGRQCRPAARCRQGRTWPPKAPTRSSISTASPAPSSASSRRLPPIRWTRRPPSSHELPALQASLPDGMTYHGL